MAVILSFIALAFDSGVDILGNKKTFFDYLFFDALFLSIPFFLLYFPLKYLIKKSFWKTLLGIFIIFVLPIIYLAILVLIQ
jgi:hypothetical protein